MKTKHGWLQCGLSALGLDWCASALPAAALWCLPPFETTFIENRVTLFPLEDFQEAMLQQPQLDGLAPRSVMSTSTTIFNIGEYISCGSLYPVFYSPPTFSGVFPLEQLVAA